MGDQTMWPLLGMMLGSGPVDELVVGLEWPMHQALRELYEEAERLGVATTLPSTGFRPSPGVALRASGANEAVWELRQRGLLMLRGTGLYARLVVDKGQRPIYARRLLRLPPDISRLVYRAGVRWAALAATASKNWPTDNTSSASHTTDGTPAALQSIRPGRR